MQCQRRDMDCNFIYSLVGSMLKPKDNGSRQQAETTLLSLYQVAPEETVNIYLDILEMHYHQQNQSNINKTETNNFHKFISLQLKLCLSKNPRHPYHPLWHKLSQNTQQRVKHKLLSMVQHSQNSDSIKQIAQIIGNLASHIIISNHQNWPQLSHFILQLALSQQPSNLYSAFLILQNLYLQQLKNHKQIVSNLAHLFQLGFQNPSIQINYSTLRCLAAYLLVLDHHRHNEYTHLIPMMIKVVTDMISHGSSKGLTVLVECLEYEPKFFKRDFHCLIQFCQQIGNSQVEENIKRTVTTALLQFSILCPSLFRTNPVALNLLVDMVILRMLMLPESISPQWMAPEQGFNNDSSDQPQLDIIKTNLWLLNRLIRSVGEDHVLPRIQQNVDRLLSMDKWTYHYAAVAILSQLGQYISDIDELKTYITLIFQMFTHQNPKLRFIAVHAIGMLAQQRKKDILKRYASLYLHNLCELLMRQACPRVVSHIWNALINLLAGLPYKYLQTYYNQLIATLIDCLVNGISIVKQAALMALSELVGSAYEGSEKDVVCHLPLLFRTISQYFYNQEYLSPCYNYLRGIALETMSSIALLLGRQEFRIYLRPFVVTLLHLQSQQYNSLIPPHGYLISTWTRLGYAFGAELEQYIHDAMPKMLQLILDKVKNHSEQEMNDSQDDSEQHFKVGKKQQQMMNITKQIELGVKMMNALISNLPSTAQCYYEEISAINVALMIYSPDEDLKQQVYSSLSTFISQLNDDIKKVETGVHLIDLTIKSIPKQNESALLSYKFKAIASMLSLFSLKILHPQLLHKLTALLHRQLTKSDNQIGEIMLRSVDFDQDQIQEAQGEIRLQQEIQEAVSDVFTEVMHLYGKEVVDFAMMVLREFVAGIFQEGQRENRLKVGLFLIDDMIQYLGYECLKQHWLWIEHILQNYTQSSYCSIRQAACYGLGILSQQYPPQLKTAQNATGWLQLLHSAYQIPKQKKDSKIKYITCTDNIIAAMGKIINSHKNHINLQEYIDFWLNNLPLKRDLLENIEMTNIVIEMVENCTQTMCEHSKERTLQMLRLIAEGRQALDKQQATKLRNCLQIVLQSSIFVINTQQLTGQLNQQTRSKLQQLYNFQSPSNH